MEIISKIFVFMGETEISLMPWGFVNDNVVLIYSISFVNSIRRRKSRTRRYGLLSSRGDKLEMAPLENADDDDEEDVTVYEMNGKRLR